MYVDEKIALHSSGDIYSNVFHVVHFVLFGFFSFTIGQKPLPSSLLMSDDISYKILIYYINLIIIFQA